MAAGIYKKFVELLPYPLRLIENPTRTQDVMGPYRELLSEGAREGFTPVILTLTEALLEAMRMNLADWAGCSQEQTDACALTAYTQQLVEKYRSALRGTTTMDIAQQAFTGTHPAAAAALFQGAGGGLADFYDHPDFTLHNGSSGSEPVFLAAHQVEDGMAQPGSLIVIAKIPAQHPADIPVYLPTGGWNNCPSTNTQLAIAHYWYEKYGAYIAAVGGDKELEFNVTRPSTNPEDTKRLAAEQYIFCPELVGPICSSFEELAQGIYRNRQWYFWWE